MFLSGIIIVRVIIVVVIIVYIWLGVFMVRFRLEKQTGSDIFDLQ